MTSPETIPEGDPAWPPPPPGWRHDAPDPPEAFPVPFTILDGLGLVVWSIVAQLFVAVPLEAGGISLSEGGIGFLLAAIVMQMFTFAGVLVWLRVRDALSWRLLGPVRPGWGRVPAGIGVGIVGFLVVTLLILVIEAAAGGIAPPDQLAMESALGGGPAFVLGIVMAVVLAPVVEETIFRGVLFQAIRHRWGLFPGMFLSGAVFAILHTELSEPIYLVALWLLGIWLAAAFHRTGTLLVPILGHATFNGIAIGLAYLGSNGPAAT